MGVARLMAPPNATSPMIQPTAAPPPTPRMHAPPTITTTSADAAAFTAAGGEEAAAAETTEATPLNVNVRETHFGGSVGVGEVGEDSGTGAQTTSSLPKAVGGAAKRATEHLNPSSANSLTPAAAAGAAAGVAGGGGGLSVSQRVRRVSMAMSIASEGKKRGTPYANATFYEFFGSAISNS